MFTHATALLSLASIVLADKTASSAAAASSGASKYSSKAGVVQFDNLGYSGRYYPVAKAEALSDGNCSCSLDTSNPMTLDGTLAPFDEEVSVHIRGPMNLRKFAVYYTDDYSAGSSSGTWTREAYFDAEEGSAKNVTFLANVGEENSCLGNALNYCYYDEDSGLMAQANSSEVFANTTIGSAREFSIYSGVKCSDSSSSSGDCGVYRSGIDAYHGFGGVNKAFLFEFAAPSDLSEEDETNKTDNYDMPAIWLLNAQIPRTSQYPTNGNCSAWNSGAGEFDILEVMNYTERNHFYTTIHDYQGTGDIETGMPIYAWIERTPDSVMKGGVFFGSDGSATVFLSNDTLFDESIGNNDTSTWITGAKNDDGGENARTLSSASLASDTATATGGSSSSKGDAVYAAPRAESWVAAIAAIAGIFIL